jgi:cysteinyl-tRNA synthetase
VSGLRFYNTLTRRKEEFAVREPGPVRIYSCGPTVYSHAHLGNMRPYLFVDLLKRTLRYFGHDVRHVINITDVGHIVDDADLGEDKIELAARQQGVSAWEIAERWTQVFKSDLAQLGVEEPDIWCKATDHIDEQIEMIERLEEKGFTYRTSDGIYFDTSKDPHYGELARLNLDQQQVQERIGQTPEKRHPQDFALWKLSVEGGPKRQMEWDSPWGRGFPGWHLECSAMSSKYLGETFDVHTGGVDHVPVHHTNEIAQSESAFGKRPWVKFWMHSAWMMFEKAKMSKSKGTTVNLDQLMELGIEPAAYRLFHLNAHYRQQTSFSDEGLQGAQTAYRRLVRLAGEIRAATDSAGSGHVEAFRVRFRAALADDLNAPQALAVTWEVVRTEVLGSVEKWELLREFDTVLGLRLAEATAAEVETDARIDALVRERDAAREAKDWARADEIRAQLGADGITLEDSRKGTRWHRG